ncbi:hypothetical protein HMPREF1214_01574 [Bacteroides sp. HPS0048]|uniref:hypothetical protein n=1 Tax=Bacteroides sp. HPS0048 TaxID=1078089 RepID=UPI00036FC348|nr:hypothetical protein [Bacteroides sp. HPS0048]EOA59422.1 hypothetical protein HMPREF1214_01574 [Bacteroides sp. HPS0048]
MDVKKKILLFLLIGGVTVIQAQKKERFTPPDMTQKTHTFALPELQIDSTFITNLNAVIFEKEGCGVEKSRESKNFHVIFEMEDSTNYSICLSLWDIPAKKSIGFFECNDFFYWLGGEIPPDIILETKIPKKISYKDPIPAFYDPPFWTLIYHTQTGNIEFKGNDCDCY